VKIEWAELAELQFLELLSHIHTENPGAAWRLHQRTIQWASRLGQFPHSGRPGRLPGSRELFVVGTPFLLIYSVREAFVSIDFVIHTSQQWPPEQ
jgi:plasmid stabilization system protein ParE